MNEPWKAKPYTRSKTLWLAAASVALGAAVVGADYNWPGICGPELVGVAKGLIGAALIFAGNRFFTFGPVATK